MHIYCVHVVRERGVESLGSSYDGAAFASGVVRLVSDGRTDMVLNSLSRDFIAASFALLGEGCAFQEIGKRGIWAAARHAASSSATSHGAIALDGDMAHDPMWMHRTLELLALEQNSITPRCTERLLLAMNAAGTLATLSLGIEHGAAFRRPRGASELRLTDVAIR